MSAPPPRTPVVVGHVSEDRRSIRVRCCFCGMWHLHGVEIGTYVAPCGKGAYRAVVEIGGDAA